MSFSNITFGSNSTLYNTFTAPILGVTPGFLYTNHTNNSSNFIFDSVSNITNAISSNLIYSTPYSNTQTSYFLTKVMHTFLSSNTSSTAVVAQFLEARSNTTAPINYICAVTTQQATVPVGIRAWTGY